MDYPAPSYAAYIWIAGDKLTLAFPGTTGRGHSVVLNADEHGLAAAMAILRERQRTGATKIGPKATPTQSLADEMARAIRSNRKVTSADEAQEARDWLKELGL